MSTATDAIASPVLDLGADPASAEAVLERLRGLAGDGGEGWAPSAARTGPISSPC